jgi:hypothetical protein
VLFHHDSSAAPQTVQTASPVCGTKNFVSVRLYSAPQLHRTIVAIYVICAANRAFSRAVSLSAPIRVPALFPDARPTAIDRERPSLCSAVGKLVTRPFGTFFKHASSFDKVLGCGHWHLLAESNELQSITNVLFPGLERFPLYADAQAGCYHFATQLHGTEENRALAAPQLHQPPAPQLLDGEQG